MNILKAFLTALAWLTVPSYCFSGAEDNGGFSITQVARGQRLRTPVYDMIKTYGRYSKLVAGHSEYNTNCPQRGSVTASPLQYDSAYVCPVQVGGQTVHLDFDTGSSDLWAFSTLLPRNETGNHTLYNPAASDSSHQLDGLSWNITYGDNSSAGGLVYQDVVGVGGVFAPAQAVQAASTVSGDFAAGSRDGILGLAFDDINTVQPTRQKTFFSNVAPTLRTKVFTAYLRKGEPGSYDFGFIDHRKYSGKLDYVPVNNAHGLWQFTAGGYAIGTGPISGSIGTAVADTGTSLCYFPASIVEAYYKQVAGATYDNHRAAYIFPCTAWLPDLKLQLGNNTIIIPGLYFNYALINVHDRMCLGGLQKSLAPGISIFGDIFFKSAFVVFDQTQKTPRLGFAPQRF